MSAFDVITVAVLALVGVRIAGGTRIALSGAGRTRVQEIVRGLRPVHFALAFPALCCVLTAVIVLLQIPGLDWGWWTAMGGLGNPVTGGTDRTSGTALEWLVPLVFIVALVPALPLFAEAEERIFRLGAEKRSPRGRLWRSIQFGLAHAIVGIPVGAALGLSVGGAFFTWRYLRTYRATLDTGAATLESTRCHLAYNAVALSIALLVITRIVPS
jgi:hypothetical protein